MKKESIFLMLFIICFTICGFAYYVNMQNNKKVLTFENDNDIEMSSDEEMEGIMEQNAVISVYICGEVLYPGVYEFNEGDRIVKAVEKAGGFTEDADETAINLSEIMHDEQQITVYQKNSAQGGTVTAPQNQKININTADLETLKKLPGVGDVTATDIINYRNNNVFKKITDIKKVSGIGDKTYERIKDLIVVD